MKVIAILDKSAGNDTVGEMWQETAIFDENTPLKEVLLWAVCSQRGRKSGTADMFRGNLKLAVGQGSSDAK